MDILFVTDYVCPYCIVAKVALKKAIEELGIDAKMTTHPFELTTTNKERVDTYSDPVRREHYKVLDKPMEALGLSLHIPPKVVPRPYTHLAFQGYFFAKEYGKEEAYSDAIYYAYFKDELDIGDLDVLTKKAKEVGLDENLFRLALEENKYSSQVKIQDDFAKQRLNVKHVPTIFVDGNEISVDEYSVEAFKKVLLDQNQSSEDGFSGCGEDGCGEASFGCGEDGCNF